MIYGLGIKSQRTCLVCGSIQQTVVLKSQQTRLFFWSIYKVGQKSNGKNMFFSLTSFERIVIFKRQFTSDTTKKILLMGDSVKKFKTHFLPMILLINRKVFRQPFQNRPFACLDVLSKFDERKILNSRTLQEGSNVRCFRRFSKLKVSSNGIHLQRVLGFPKNFVRFVPA